MLIKMRHLNFGNIILKSRPLNKLIIVVWRLALKTFRTRRKGYNWWCISVILFTFNLDKNFAIY